MIASTLRALVNAVRTAAHVPPETSVKKRIATAAAAIGTLSVVVKGASLASTLVIASFFGTGDALEAYLIAFLAPSVLITVVSRSFRSVTVPTYVQVLEQQGPDEAQRLFSTITFLAIALLALVAALFAISSSYLLPLIGSGFSAEKLALTQQLAYLLVPAILLKGLSTIYASVLNARERFSLAAFAPILVPVSTVLATLAWQVPATRIYAVAIGTVIGMLGETAVVAWGLKRQRVVLRPRWPRSTAASRQVIAQYFPMVAAALLMSGTTFVDQAMAASLPAGSVASLSYGGRVVNVALHLVTGAIGVAVLPFFSKMVDAGNWNELRSVLRVYSTWLLVSHDSNRCVVGSVLGFHHRAGSGAGHVQRGRHRPGWQDSDSVRAADALLRLWHPVRTGHIGDEGQSNPDDWIPIESHCECRAQLRVHATMGSGWDRTVHGVRVSSVVRVLDVHDISATTEDVTIAFVLRPGMPVGGKPFGW